jgi:hypothetical protein
VDNPHLTPQLAREAAAYVLGNVHGPHIALYLVKDSPLSERTSLARSVRGSARAGGQGRSKGVGGSLSKKAARARCLKP